MTESTKKNCWNCHYVIIGGTTFLGKCGWFTAVKFKPPKEIPAKIVDVGCKFWKERGKNESSAT